MFASVSSLGLKGIDGFVVNAEADISQGLPSFELVGLPDAAVRESRDRVRAVLKNAGFDYPVSRITVNLAPADVKKEGPVYDLPLCLCILTASKQLRVDLARKAFIGELSLAGDIRPVRGVLSMTIAARDAGFTEIYVPKENGEEAAVVEGITVYAPATVTALVHHLEGKQPLTPVHPTPDDGNGVSFIPDFVEVKGQETARRVMEIAAAGSHNVLLLWHKTKHKEILV